MKKILGIVDGVTKEIIVDDKNVTLCDTECQHKRLNCECALFRKRLNKAILSCGPTHKRCDDCLSAFK